MSTNPQQAMLIDTTRAISSTNSPALVMPMQSDPSVIAPGGKWYMVYVPPGGILPMTPLAQPVALPPSPTPDAAVVSVAEATSSSGPETQSIDCLATPRIERQSPKPKRGKRGAKTVRTWRKSNPRKILPPRENSNLYQPYYLPQPKYLRRIETTQDYRPRSFCNGNFY